MGKINIVLMILIMLFVIVDGIVLYLLNIRWYFCAVLMLYLMGQSMILSYESKIIYEQRTRDQKRTNLSKTLERTFSRILYLRLKGISVEISG